MDKFEKGIQKLQKLQHQVEKQYTKMSKLAKRHKKEFPFISDVKMPHLTKNDFVTHSAVVLNKKTRKVGLVLLIAVAIGVLATFIVRRVKKLNMNFDDNTRFDVAYGDDLADPIEEFDFEHASLEELEEALLRVENELNEVTVAIEKNKN